MTCARAPLLGRRGVSVRSRKYGVCKSISQTMFVNEGAVKARLLHVKGQKGESL